MGAVQFDDVETDALHALSRGDEVGDGLFDLVARHGVRHRPALVERDGGRPGAPPSRPHRWAERLAAGGRRLRRALAAGMRQLHAELGNPVGAAEIVHALERRLIGVRIHTGAFGGDASDGVNVGHFGHDQAGGAEREAAEVHQMPVVRRTVVGIVLAHGRNHDAVRQCQTAHGDRRKQGAAHRRKFLSAGESEPGGGAGGLRLATRCASAAQISTGQNFRQELPAKTTQARWRGPVRVP